MREAGVPVGLGCDGGASSGHGSLWLETRIAMLAGHLVEGRPALTARDALELATVGGASCLGRTGELGVLVEGAVADFVVWPLDEIRFIGILDDLVEGWLRAGPASPRHSYVAGSPVVRDGQLVADRLTEMVERHTVISREWQAPVLDA